ncbi:CATRA conflict system CASPASE/TPR repeat-associated protein [Dactylosporangium cerinum]
MTAAGLVEPEFVVHLFAPTDGPDAGAALAGVRALWENCRDQLGMTQPIVEVRLPADLPADLADGPDGALAGLQDPAVQFQAIARREHDVLNVSFAIAAPGAVPRSRTRLGSALPPGWHEFHRWWRTLGAGTALLGGAVVLLAKSGDPAGADLRTAVPAQDDDGDGWWETGFALHGFAAWETTPAGTHGTRRLVLLAGLDEDAELSRFAWSDGGTALPPLGRYLMHAAKLRYQARVLGDGGQLTRLRRRVNGRLDELTGLLRAPGGAGRAVAADLAGDRADLAATLQSLRVMRRTVDIARGNMAGTLDGPLPADAPLGDWLAQQLVDDTDLLEATWERAERVAAMLDPPDAPPSPLSPPSPGAAEAAGAAGAARGPSPTEVEYRVGFDVDVVNYSGRSTPRQVEVQHRVAGMVERILARIGVPVHETDRQPAGDGMMVVLPARVPADVALPALLHGWRAQVVADNAEHPHDRIRLRLSVGSGPFTRSAIGFSGQAIIEVGRLLDCQPLRQAVLDHPDADLVAIVADRIYRDVVVEGYRDCSPRRSSRPRSRSRRTAARPGCGPAGRRHQSPGRPRIRWP